MPRDYDDYDDDGHDEPPRRPAPRRPQQAPSKSLMDDDLGPGDDQYDDGYDDDYEDGPDDGHDDDGYEDDGYDDEYDDRAEPPRRTRQAPPSRRAPARTPHPPPARRARSDRQIYDRYQRSRTRARTTSPMRSGRTPTDHRAAVDAYRRRKAQQGIATGPTPVRVARRAPSTGRGHPEVRKMEKGFYKKAQRKKKKGSVAKSIVVLVILVLVFLIPFSANVMPEFRDVLMSDLTEPSPRLLPASAEYHMQRVFTVTVSSGTVTYNLKVPVPYDIPEAQEIIEFTASPSGTRDGSTMRWSGDTSGSVQIVVSYHLKATTKKWGITPEISGTTKDVPASYHKYLGDEWKIKPSDPNIKTLAAEIAGDEVTVYGKLKALADWMRNNILYEKQRGWQPKDPLETLSDGTGDCDDQSILFASLARAQGIPAWLEMGALYDQFQKQWGGHAWLRAYIPLITGSGQKVNLDPANKEFLVRDPFRITEWEADGNGDHLQNYYTLWSFSYTGHAVYDADAQYLDISYERSSDTVSDKPPGSGMQAWEDSWRLLPAFELLLIVPAMTIAGLIANRRLRRRA